MDLGLGSTLLPGDPRLIDHIVGEVKSQGIFDQFRKDALADVDTKPAYQNLRTRVEGSVNSFLSKQVWKPDLNKNQLRETLRKHISEAAYLDAGVERIVDQVVNPKIYSVFTPQIEDVVYKYLGLEKPKREKNGGHSIKDLLPIDLDPVSPESDKNSLKDVSLDSVDDLPITSKEDSDLVDHKNDDSSQVGDRDKSFEEKETVDSREAAENEANGNESVQSTAEEEKVRPGCSTPQPVDPGLNDSIKSGDKTEEEEEDSPVFEPIDIMNFNDSIVSNDSHLSGISELTSHRSRSPDFQINEFSRDHFDFSNQDSQFSKVSSDSRLSIVTDFGSSNQASTPVPDIPKEEKSKDKSDDDKNKDKDKERSSESKDTKNSKSSSSKERGREKSDYKSKSSKERSDSRDSRSHRERDYKKKSTDSKSDRDRSKSSRDSSDKSRDKDKDKDGKDKVRDEKTSSAGKDLKDIYKEKIRELREKKELTEKEKLNKDKDSHKSRDSKDKKDSKDSSEKDSKDRRDSKEHRSSSSSSRSHRHDSRSKRDDSKSSRDKKRDDRHSRDKSRSQGDSDSKRSSKDDKSDKDKDSKSTQKRKESRADDSRKSSDKSSTDKDKDKDKDKKRRDEKKSKSKDDHSSLRKSSNDRRSSDRDGSSGSNGKGSKNSCPGSSASSSKANSGLKETGNVSNSSSEASDGVDESQVEEYHNTDGESAIQVDQETEVSGVNAKRVDLGQSEISLPLKKRPLPAEDADSSAESSAKKMKFANNFKEDDKFIKLKKQFEQSVPDVNHEQDIKVVPDDERVQIIEVREPQDDDDEDEPYPDDKDVNSKLGQPGVIMEGENFFKMNVIDNCKSNLTEMEMSIRESLNEMMADKIIGRDGNDKKQDMIEDELENSLNLNKSNDLSGEEVKARVESDDEDCLYFVEDNERLNKFKLFLKSLDIDTGRDIDDEAPKDLNTDDIEVKRLLPDDENEESAATVTMAPPQLKRKYSASPLSDIVLNSENNNDGHKVTGGGDAEKDKKKAREKDTGLGKKKLGRPKRQRPSVSSSSPNDDFMMPLSPESDVSATSDKASANHKDKDDKRLKNKQRYTSDDLYKPRPLFVGSSRRNRRSNQA
ncbi:dentin sialophosphoprotein-like [Microplitis mediator]|uniref:dentin sialophosphoprotein-like n=1 Tax=Microplitis mediator TaxID=375433 RepID=UPI0025559B0A|nr:dentin sialophosphoprotein-like [Microplitis mediator]